MKIAFVTSGLEPGHNGVGDYTTLLAAECERAGHTSFRIALNDREAQAADHADRELRLSTALPWEIRAALARRLLTELAPDFVSVQFVGYGFHPRGLVGRVARHLRTALRGWPLHVFMHELWLGEQCGAPWKERAIGWLQRRGVLALLRSLDMRLVHTSNDSYAALLTHNGVPARRLPLFGPLPLPAPAPPRGEGLTFAFFGTLHPVWPPEPLFAHLRALGDHVTLTHVGAIGAGAALWDSLAQRYPHFTFRRLGEQPPQAIADFFAAADFGIATTPWAILGKSATVAAMLEAGLPVIVNRDETRFSGVPDSPSDDPQLIRMTADLPGQLRAARRRPPRLRLPEIASRFLAELEIALA